MAENEQGPDQKPQDAPIEGEGAAAAPELNQALPPVQETPPVEETPQVEEIGSVEEIASDAPAEMAASDAAVDARKMEMVSSDATSDGGAMSEGGSEDAAEDNAAAAPPPPMPATRSKSARTLSSLNMSEQSPLAPDTTKPAPVRTPTAPALRMAGLSVAAGLALGLVALLFAAPVNPWVGLLGFAALMLTTLVPARLIAVVRSEGRSIAGWIAVWAMTLAGVAALGLVVWAEMSVGLGAQAVEPLARVAALLALSGLTLAPVLRADWALRTARGVAALFALWALGEAALIGFGGVAAGGAEAAGTVFFEAGGGASLVDRALGFVGVYLGAVWPHAPLLAAIPALLALRAPGGSFLIAAAVFAVLGYLSARLAPGVSAVDAGGASATYYQAVDGVRRLIGACVLALPMVPIAALAASHRKIQPLFVRIAACIALALMCAADVWTFVGAPAAINTALSAAGAEAAAPDISVSPMMLDLIRGLGAIAFIGASLLGALWFAGLAAFGRRTA